MKRLVSILCLALLPFLGLHGQGKIEQLDYMYYDQSIIREVDANRWIVYTHDDGVSFSLIVNGNSTVNFLALPAEFTSVADFTFFNNYVYFCGKRRGKPVLGYFYINAFTDTSSIFPIHYSEMTGVDTLTAIKVFETPFAPQKPFPYHVLMLGKNGTTGILVEALTPSYTTGWDAYYITLKTSDGNTVLHDDIDILDDYVVVASHRLVLPSRDIPFFSTNGTGYLWYIRKPAIPSYPLLTTPYYFSIPSIVTTWQLKLTACEDKACVVAAMAAKKINNSNITGIHVYGYDYPYNIKSTRIVDNYIGYESLKALCYDKTNKCTQLLVQYNNGTISNSRIYSLTQPAAYPGTTIYQRIFTGSKINSLITRFNSSKSFIGSGVNLNNFPHLNIYRYQDTAIYNSSDSTSCVVESIELQPISTGQSTYTWLIHSDSTAIPIHKETRLRTICQ